MARASEDYYIYSSPLECGCKHYFYKGPDTYCYTVLCQKHRESLDFKKGSTAVGLQTRLENV